MSIHRIRLNGFWTITPLAAGQVRHARKFGSPRRQSTSETVWLTCDQLPGVVRVWVNSEPVGDADGGGPIAIDVTRFLQPRNEVWIDTVNDGVLGEVAIEIRDERSP